jgi:CO dehydrogenase maturation factor
MGKVCLVRVALVGKGGAGKTTVAALLARRLAETGAAVWAIDADINQHLAVALGADEVWAGELPTLADQLPAVKEYLRGANPRIGCAEEMVKTTPAGAGSRLLRVVEDNPIYAACLREVGDVRVSATGRFAEDDLGVACYHSKVGAVELLLNHLVDGSGEYVVVDMTAGADAFASGLFTRFDQTFVVCEPTLRALGVYRQYRDYAAEFGVAVAVVGNKVADDADVEFLREQVGDALVGWLGVSSLVRAGERGEHRPLDSLEQHNRDTLDIMRAKVDATVKDWSRFQRQAVQFHLRNAAAWANDRAGFDLSAQVDPDFEHGPGALACSGQVPASLS